MMHLTRNFLVEKHEDQLTHSIVWGQGTPQPNWMSAFKLKFLTTNNQ